VKPDEIRTSRGVATVPFEQRQELAERLENAGFGEAALDIRNHRLLAESRNKNVLDVVRTWGLEKGLSDELHTLRDLLYDDVRTDLPGQDE
jgi:hypothetical protein